VRRIRQQGIALSTAALLFVTSARAQEITPVVESPPTTPAPEQQTAQTPTGIAARPVDDVLGLTSRTLRHSALSDAMASSSSSSSSSSIFANGAMKDIRLSSGAKTAIIITAIIVGGLIIIGVVVVGKPHKHL
jgi:hypothetical protein